MDVMGLSLKTCAIWTNTRITIATLKVFLTIGATISSRVVDVFFVKLISI